ncbi:MAG: DUF3422 domain-containing protein [Alphaproteobacteria bacterium]
MLGNTEHPHRFALVNELHSRQSESCLAPECVTHYAVLRGEGGIDEDRNHVASLCKRFGATPPPPDSAHYSVDLGNTRLKWERHTEFTTYTFFKRLSAHSFFDTAADSDLPQDWKDATPGELIAAIHVTMQDAERPMPTNEELNNIFVPDSIVTTQVSGGGGQIWTDFRLHGEGFSRILIRNSSMSQRRLGRTLQRLLEIETYRLMALLGLPVARDVSPKLSLIDGSLAHLTLGMNGSADKESDATLLRRLTRVSGDIETLSTQTAYRFSATAAYYALVQTRVKELREDRVEGNQTIQEFIDRRLAPAARTCDSVATRIGDLSQRATRAANLLRTRVDFALQEQNQQLLASMDRRARLQVRLQQTVEGLSVAAISYYAVGLIGYVVKGGEHLLPGLESATALAVATPVVIAIIWFLLSRFRRKVEDSDSSG